MRLIPKAAGALFALALTATPALRADAPNLSGFVNAGAFFATATGDVTITFLFSRAAFTNDLILFQNIVPGAGMQLINVPGAFPNPGAGTPSTFTLTNVQAGTPLLFGICTDGGGGTAADACATGFSAFFMGPGSNNVGSDGLMHAAILTAVDWNNNLPLGFDPKTNAPAGTTVVGFEDIAGGGDLDFNDVVFAFTNVSTVPEPATMGLLAIGLVGLAGAGHARRRRARKDENA